MILNYRKYNKKYENKYKFIKKYIDKNKMPLYNITKFGNTNFSNLGRENIRKEKLNMTKFFKHKIKIIIAVLLIIMSIAILKININSKTQLASIKEEKATSSIIELKAGSKIYENISDTNNILNNNQNSNKSMNDNQNDNENVDNKFDTKELLDTQNIFNAKNLFDTYKSNKVEINTKDTKAPDNINDISVQVLENNAIINFDKPKDNGINYEYIVEDNENREKLNFYSESGIYGYSYKINNNKDDKADEKVNKIDDLPFIIQNIDWNKDYYLHIRTADNNKNFSESVTFKINLPSNGVNVEYVDTNTGKVLASAEKISGMINESYNASSLEKKIADYTFVENEGNLEGMLKKEQVSVKYKYAKNATLTIKYIDKQTGNELISPKKIQGYEGKVINIDKTKIDGYICETKINSIKLNKQDETISLLYNKTGNIIISYIDESTNEKLCEDDVESMYYGNSYSFAPKEFENYELIKSTENDKGTLNSDCINIVYYYKPKYIINLKYVDIDTDEMIYEEKIAITKGDKVKVKIKEIEGYSLIEDYNNDDDTIIDEIIKSLGSDLEKDFDSNDDFTTNEKDNIQSQYEIVMNCDDSDYIIYYKKV